MTSLTTRTISQKTTKLETGVVVIAELPLQHLAIYHGKIRVDVFLQKGTACVCCNKVGKHFLLYDKGQGKQVGLFTDDGVMMTVDHIIAKCKGGKYTVENLQPMCRVCNSIKADLDLTIPELRERIKMLYSLIDC